LRGDCLEGFDSVHDLILPPTKLIQSSRLQISVVKAD
jgi:hypothetical protein